MNTPLERLHGYSKEYLSSNVKSASTDIAEIAVAGVKVATNYFSPITENFKYLTTGSGGPMPAIRGAYNDAVSGANTYLNPVNVFNRAHDAWSQGLISQSTEKAFGRGDYIGGALGTGGDLINTLTGSYFNASKGAPGKVDTKALNKYIGGTPDPSKSKIHGGAKDTTYDSWLTGTTPNPYANVSGQ